MENVEKQLEQLTNAITRLVNQPIAPVAPVAPILPLAPIVQQNTGDHDIINTLVGAVRTLDQKFSEKFADLKTDIKNISDGAAIRIEGHETRIRLTETAITQVKTYGTAGIFVLGIMEFLLNKFL